VNFQSFPSGWGRLRCMMLMVLTIASARYELHYRVTET
jgi:hypothetical protein